MRIPSLLPALLLTLGAGSLQAQSNWIDFTDETSTRISGNPAVTTADPEEKDLWPADLDKDGDQDLIIVRKAPFSTPGQEVNVLLMNEGGVLTERTSTLIPGFNTADDARDVITVDANQDGWEDIVVCNTFSDDPRLFLSQGEDSAGNFLGFVEDTNWFSPAFPIGPKFCAVAGGDINDDDYPDLFFVDYDNGLEDVLLVNDGTGKYVDETSTRLASGFETSGFGTSCFIYDLNYDGFEDILKLSTLTTPRVVRLLFNDGTGNFSVKQDLFFDQVYMLDLADYDNDGRTDIYVESDGQDYILYNDATTPGGELVTTTVYNVNSILTSGFGGNAHSADLDRDGYMDVGVADVDTDIPGCTREHAVLRNRLPNAGVNGMADPNNGTLMPWNMSGTYDFAWMDINQDGFQDMVLGTCDGLRVWMMNPFAAASKFGEGCPGTGGIVPQISVNSEPTIPNASLAISLSQAPANALAALMLSGGPVLAQGPCQFLVNLPILSIRPKKTDGSGNSTLSGAIANDPSLEGLRLLAQWIVRDPGSSLSGWSLTEGLDLYFSQTTLP